MCYVILLLVFLPVYFDFGGKHLRDIYGTFILQQHRE